MLRIICSGCYKNYINICFVIYTAMTFTDFININGMNCAYWLSKERLVTSDCMSGK